MTQAYNLSQLANNLNSAGQLDATDGLVNAVPVANGGTGASTAAAARSNLGLVIGTNVPSPTGDGASGNWNINAATATSASSASTASYATTAGNGGVTSVDSSSGSINLANLPAFSRNFAVGGYQKLPGGLIIQWQSCGRGTTALPIAFPNSVLGWSFCTTSGDEGPFSTNEMSITVDNNNVYYAANRIITFRLIAIGY